MTKRSSSDVAISNVPEATVDLADRRVEAIVRSCCRWEQNILQAIARSCYLQGVIDGAQVAAQRPEIAALDWGRDPETTTQKEEERLGS